jgi:hypothetical protein
MIDFLLTEKQLSGADAYILAIVAADSQITECGVLFAKRCAVRRSLIPKRLVL